MLQLQQTDAKFKALGIAAGEACSTHFFGISVGDRFTYREAMLKAIAKLDGDILVQTSTDLRRKHFFPIYFQTCLIVEGIVVKLEGLPKKGYKPLPESKRPSPDKNDDYRKRWEKSRGK